MLEYSRSRVCWQITWYMNSDLSCSYSQKSNNSIDLVNEVACKKCLNQCIQTRVMVEFLTLFKISCSREDPDISIQLVWTRRPLVPRMALTSASDGSSTITLSPSILTGKVTIDRSPSSCCPFANPNCFLCRGHAIFRVYGQWLCFVDEIVSYALQMCIRY